jgi:predicted DNA-binding transcriptional regulator AlpA
MDTVQANVTGEKRAPLTITIKSAMQLSGLSRATINRLMWSGKLRSSTVGSRRLIKYASFVEVLGLNPSEAA